MDFESMTDSEICELYDHMILYYAVRPTPEEEDLMTQIEWWLIERGLMSEEGDELYWKANQ